MLPHVGVHGWAEEKRVLGIPCPYETGLEGDEGGGGGGGGGGRGRGRGRQGGREGGGRGRGREGRDGGREGEFLFMSLECTFDM